MSELTVNQTRAHFLVPTDNEHGEPLLANVIAVSVAVVAVVLAVPARGSDGAMSAHYSNEAYSGSTLPYWNCTMQHKLLQEMSLSLAVQLLSPIEFAKI
eukprot:6190296-Pleurochrysis_carterae.AAC.2